MGVFGLIGIAKDTMPGVVDAAMTDARTKIGELRKAGQILKSNPLGALVTELVFPEPVADGTLDAAMKRGDHKSRLY